MAEGTRRSDRAGGWRRYRVVLYLLLGLAAVDLAVAAHRPVWRAYDPDEYRERLRTCRRGQHDLVLVGGSVVAEGLDPAALRGLAWQGRPLERPYNLGLPGGTTSEVWHAVEHGLAAPPRLLVYGVTASDLNDHRDEPQGPEQLMTWDDLRRWVRYRPGAAWWAPRHFLQERLARLWQLQYYRNGIRLWAADQVERCWPGPFAGAAAEAHKGLARSAALRREDGYAPDAGTQVRTLARFKAHGSFGPPFHFLDGYRLGGHLRYLHHLLDWAEAHGVAVVLVDMPVSADLEERLHPREFARYRAALDEVGRQRGVPVLHAGRADVGLDDTHFADLVHLNARGAARLSGWLRQWLAASEFSGGAKIRAANARIFAPPLNRGGGQ
jgi:hypothetical protein